MAARDTKPAMKVSLSRSRIPSFLFAVLVLMVIVLAYYYWTLSATNQQLLRELKIIQGGKLVSERRRTALESQVFHVENERRVLKDDLDRETERRIAVERTAFTETSALKGQLLIKEEQLNAAEKIEVSVSGQCTVQKISVTACVIDV